ncbi:putative bifunctional diguanylate cyclase/phosphodiesterase [Flaviflagellibacter deserti]|uniref:Bifunctional diguanylate cyclase/phosphodiesterase n=1 Tax=Flaviflagellibacter deserti TaxID=2267266 RepID=A0ABV9YV92_9HYPH
MIVMAFLVFAGLTALVLVGLEVDLLQHFRDRSPLQDMLEIEEILLITGLLVVSLLAFAGRRLYLQKLEIRRREAAERYALDLAFHDPLTGLPNRRNFLELVDAALAEPPRGDNVHAVMLLDLNSFKAVNDVHGHPAGDELLIEIGKALNRELSGQAEIARLGGDEFAVVAKDIDGANAAASIGRRIIALLDQPIRTRTGEHRVGTGIGVAIAPKDGTDRAELIRKADVALYRAKAEGTSFLSFFEEAMDARMHERAFVETELREALASSGIVPVYQPNVDLTTNKITGFEVVPHWRHPYLGEIGSQRFLPVAEDSGLIRELTDQLLRRACLDALSWPDTTILSFRLADAVMRDHGLPLRILGILGDTRFRPARLEIAIGEAALMRNMKESRRLLAPLREAGIKLALADFGTSYASIWHLRDLHFDKLKIDRSFIQDLDQNPNSAVVVKTILGMGKGLGIAISASGIGQSEQRDKLKSEGLIEGQGDLFGRGLTSGEASKLVSSRTPLLASA